MTPAYCPKCGRGQAPDARFCPNCGEAFDPAGVGFAAVQSPTATVSPPAKNGIPPAVLIGLLIVLGVIGAFGYNAVKGGAAVPGGVPSSANVPPGGTIWFGSSFDATTFEIPSRVTSGTAGQTIALVGHLSRTITMSNANLRISLDGTTILNQALGLTGEGDIYGVTYTPPVAGTYRFEVTDVGGAVLASGTITVT